MEILCPKCCTFKDEEEFITTYKNVNICVDCFWELDETENDDSFIFNQEKEVPEDEDECLEDIFLIEEELMDIIDKEIQD